MKRLLRQAKNEMRQTKQEQELLYEKHVISKLVEGADPNEVGEGYQDYLEDLDGFHALAFDQVIDSILEDDDERILDHFTTGFESVPEYLVHRSGWGEKVKNLMQDDSPTHIKSASVDSLDRSRTKAHDGVINLFNDLNSYAEDKNLPVPYPVKYGKFDKKDLNHRTDAADILSRHTPLLEKVNKVVQEKFKESGKGETIADKYRKMSLGDLLDVAKENFEQKDLPELDLGGLSQ